MNRTHEEAGFTLIELLVVIGTMGVLTYLTLSSLQIVKYNAANKVVATSAAQARVSLEAAMAEPDASYAAVNITQSEQGPISDTDGAALLPAFQVTRKTVFSFYHDPGCVDAGCTADRITVRHCNGNKYILFTRFGDGAEVLLDEVPGVGC